MIDHLREIFEEGDVNKDGKLQLGEFLDLVNSKVKYFPQLLAFKKEFAKIFAKHDIDNDDCSFYLFIFYYFLLFLLIIILFNFLIYYIREKIIYYNYFIIYYLLFIIRSKKEY